MNNIFFKVTLKVTVNYVSVALVTVSALSIMYVAKKEFS